MTGTKNHKRVAIVERHLEVGGGCTHWGTIPSKALRQVVKTLNAVRRDPLLAELRPYLQVHYPNLLSSATKVIESQVASRRRFYERNRVPVYAGHARFTDAHSIEIQPEVGATKKISADRFVIATGSRPYHPPELDFS